MNLVTNEEDTTLYQDQMKGLFPNPRTAPDDPERERLLRFFAGAHGTDESKEEELRNVKAIYALPVGSPVDLNRSTPNKNSIFSHRKMRPGISNTS